MAKQKILILYGSETGTAQDAAERIWRDAKRLCFKGPVLPMDEYDITKLIFEPLVIFVCSTTGQGDQPNNMRNFWRFLLRRNLPDDSLKFVKFGVLGLGDSSYLKFNFAAKKLHKRLLGLGGDALVSLGLADDQHDLGVEAVIEPWITELWNSLNKIYHFPEGSLPIKCNGLPPPRWKVTELGDGKGELYDQPVGGPNENNYKAKVIENTRTTTPEHFQEVRMIKLGGLGLTWSCGDVAVVRPQNKRQTVSHLMSLLPFSSDTVIEITEIDEDMPVPQHLRRPLSLQTLAINYWDLNAVARRYTLEILACITPSELEGERLRELAQGGDDWINYAVRPKRSVVELMADFPHASAHIPLSHLPELFQPIRPRSFSIASSPSPPPPPPVHISEVERSLELLIAVVKYNTKLFVPRFGLCSNWLASLAIGQEIHLTIRRGSMTFPDPPIGTVIMVGPGTGVAPFRSFVQNVSGGKKIMFFGCRNREGDFHFKDEWGRYRDLKVFTAFSRDQPYKVYVQHIIQNEGDMLAEVLLKEDASIFIAGNAKDMPESVRKAFASVLVRWGNLTEEQADAFLERMALNSRYQTETWS